MPRLPEQVPLYQLFLHNAWATEKLLDSCEPLTAEQLRATVPGAVGSLFETLHHFVQAEGGYLSRLAPELTPAHWEPRLAKTFEAVRSRARELKPLWLTFAATDPDAAQLHRKRWPDVTHEFPAYMEMAQALFHSHTHREQACMIVTSLGLEPPDLQPIAWADEIGALRRIRYVRPNEPEDPQLCGSPVGAAKARQPLQLTSNKARNDAHRFYGRLGFVKSDEGMKFTL